MTLFEHRFVIASLAQQGHYGLDYLWMQRAIMLHPHLFLFW
jgi:formylmethanofuran dehydrogenase subunit E-like metal-binding protein